MKVLIVEDENLAAEKLEKTLSEINPEVEVIGKLQSVIESVNWFHEHPEPDLIFMDIQLDDGICFEIFDAIEIRTPVIFTTAYDQYAIRAFKVNSIDYLLKPIEKETLLYALEKFKSLFQSEEYDYSKFQSLFEKMVKDYKNRFFVKIGNHFHSISVADIDCFFIREKGTFLKTKSGKNFDMDYSLDQVQKLVNPEKFFRINRNFLINIDAIQDIFSYSSSRLGIKIKMMDHLDLIVSREKVTDFKKWLDR